MENFTNDDILLRYPSCLRENIEELWKTRQIGVACKYLQVNLPPSKLDFNYDIRYGNTFTLNIPYAGKNLQWEILFNDEDPTLAPDFAILNDNFLEDPSVDTLMNCVPSLMNWNTKDSKSLINIINELLLLYKKFQLEKFENEPKFMGILDEYKRIKRELNINDDNIEIYVESNTLSILISLKLDFSKLPIYIQQSYFGSNSILLNHGIDSAILKISFFSNRVTSYLQLSPRVEAVFSDYTNLSIPVYKRNEDMVEHIQQIYHIIDDKIKKINQHFRLKEEYFSLLLSVHGLKVIEYNNINFNKGVFLFEIDNYHFLVQVTIGNKFPQEKPGLILKSVYNKHPNGEPISLKINNYQYIQQWKPEDMIENMFRQVRDSIPKFKAYCNSSTN